MSAALFCPYCGNAQTRVKNSRGNTWRRIPSVYRTRECTGCRERIFTAEIIRDDSFMSVWALAESIALLPAGKQAAIRQLMEVM